WKSVIKGTQVYVPLSVEKKMMNSVLKTHGYAQSEYHFVAGETVLPHLTPSESRLLFGGAEDPHVHVSVLSGDPLHGHAHDRSHHAHHGNAHEHKH
ncbi:TPA: urease accessory protein UreE, partial [Klebsiella pneumoniae]